MRSLDHELRRFKTPGEKSDPLTRSFRLYLLNSFSIKAWKRSFLGWGLHEDKERIPVSGHVQMIEVSREQPRSGWSFLVNCLLTVLTL